MKKKKIIFEYWSNYSGQYGMVDNVLVIELENYEVSEFQVANFYFVKLES